jgi:hypothetical protein
VSSPFHLHLINNQPPLNLLTPSLNMRFAVSVVALAAAVAAQVQPISQISDGQIQAPPATATAPAASSVPAASSAAVVSSAVYTSAVGESIKMSPSRQDN